ncbi:uncharacterized protein LOC142169948 [Nicotiana tabacum]|uniref:Uncharacterized protein LOC142169948 n=1 Tax=Nicotiana tabacum TaxID=4097 RepID=A0AC58SSN5_TOBAC
MKLDERKEATKERGLLESDNSISECLREATLFKMPAALRNLFATILLNPEQEKPFKIILQRVDSGRASLFFVDVPGGTGKIFLYRALLANVRSRGMIALATTTSGVAAIILPRGRTAHSRFDIPLQTSETTITNMSTQSGGSKLIQRANLILWDEAPMARRQTIETVNRSF